MYFKIITNFIRALFISSIVFFACSFSVNAKMKFVPKTSITNSDVTSYYSNLLKDRKLTEMETDVFQMVKLSKSIFNINSYVVPGKETEPKNLLSPRVTMPIIKRTILDSISKDPEWSRKPSKETVQLITSNAKLLKKSIGGQSYTWAWFLKYTGNIDKSKKLLEQLFADEKAQLLKLKSVSSGLRKTHPLHNINLITKALIPLSDKKEVQNISNMIRQVKIHISNIPHIKRVT